MTDETNVDAEVLALRQLREDLEALVSECRRLGVGFLRMRGIEIDLRSPPAEVTTRLGGLSSRNNDEEDESQDARAPRVGRIFRSL